MSDRVTVKQAVGVLRKMLNRPSMKQRALKLLHTLVDTASVEKVDPNYDRFCSKCGHAKIHRTNEAGMCTDCYIKHMVRT